MASITYFLFLSLLFHSILLVKSDDEDTLLQGINQYRSTLRLPPLTHSESLECLADDIADRFNNQPCPNTPPAQPRVTDYPDLLTKCGLTNATLQGVQILPVCLPESQSAQLLPSYTGPRYATYLNDTRFSNIGIGSDDNWSIIILTTTTTPPTPTTPGTPTTPATPTTPSTSTDEEDALLQGINQYRSTLSLPPLTHSESLECLADDIADRFNNQPCPNTPPAQPRVTDYPDLLTKCALTNATLQGVQILPVCLPESQSAQLITSYTGPRYATYLNDTRFSSIGIGSDDNWTVIILTTTTTPATPGTPTPPGTPTTPSTPTTPGTPTTPDTPTTPGTPATGSSTSNPDSGAPGLTAISPAVVVLIGLFMLV